MPPLFINGTEDSDIFFTIFKFNFNRFTYFSSNNNVLSNFTPISLDCIYLFIYLVLLIIYYFVF